VSIKTCLPRCYAMPLALALALAPGVSSSKDKAYQPPRLTDGHPNLQGMWDHIDATPLVRPPGITSLAISPTQAAALEQRIKAVEEDRATPNENTDYFNERHVLPIRGEFHSSIIIDPEDGTIPGTPQFQQWLQQIRVNVLEAKDGPEQRPTSERCLGNPASQPPNLYNPGTNLHQIVQSADTVIFVAEVMHDARVIRLNSKHVPANVTSWLGDSIGWWEGDTLVVERKYFTASDTGRVTSTVRYKVSPRTTVTERFTRVSDSELNYVFTVEDPTWYTRQWKGETHFMRTNDHILEYSCHEGNYSLPMMLRDARARDGK
jgi:hypothetical protein